MRHAHVHFTVETKRQPSGYAFSSERHAECQLIYVTEGSLLYHGDKADTPVVLRPHAFVLLRVGDSFRLRCEGEGYRGFCVFARGEIPRALRGESVTGLADGAVRMLGGMIQRHVTAPVMESGAALAGLGQALVWEVLALARERQHSSIQDWAEAARTVLDMNVGTGLPVRDALATIPVSYRQLCRCFADRYGTSPKAYQDLLRINEGRRMLAETPMDITSIAVELGFSSSQHFATRFRRLVGCSPSDYRDA
jgi:AraC-like DNA-binding protein